ncbi:hypothetical protein Zm00014a_036764 [Zea mays]|uniref:Uncharacterized protein n=1 Tax=Zea mays TaxID=4577 RepID=A0A3L6DZE0_MAIZE|nr:hypothetical protein Zm00014a_036764 [Zea mays]
MCLAGDGGGKGSLRSRLAGVVGAEPYGVGDLHGDATEPPKRWCTVLGLGVENAKNGDTAQCFFPGPGVAGVAEPGGRVAGAAFGIWEALRRELALAGGHGGKEKPRKSGREGGRERELWGVGTSQSEGN